MDPWPNITLLSSPAHDQFFEIILSLNISGKLILGKILSSSPFISQLEQETVIRDWHLDRISYMIIIPHIFNVIKTAVRR